MSPFRIFRAHQDFDLKQLEQMRGVINESRELLRKNPPPDAFAGRKTQEPFPMEDGELDGWPDSKPLPSPE